MEELIKQWVLATLAPDSYIVNTKPELPNIACITFFTEDRNTWTNVITDGPDVVCISLKNSTLPKHIDIPSIQEAVQLIALELDLEIAATPQ